MRKIDPIARTKKAVVAGSFRDPAGFVFRNGNGEILRQINELGLVDYDLLMSSGLYNTLVDKKLLIAHKEIESTKTHKVIQPTQIPYISYPFEWSFDQLKDAALLTLSIQRAAIKKGMALKDASAYNIQFMNGKPVFIDTLSFEAYKPGEPWQAYRQFCQHFLAPLSLMAYTDLNLSQLMRVHLDGIPLPLAVKLLPSKAKVRPGLAMHMVIHGMAQKAKATEHKAQTKSVSKNALISIIDSLERTVKKLKIQKSTTEWGDYYENTNYTAAATDKKARLLKTIVQSLNAKTVLDLGGNNGHYSRTLNELGFFTICTDIDPNAVNDNYLTVKRNREKLMLPLLIDLTNPGGGLGWHNTEREPFHQRFSVDVVMALALIHHLAISNNLPFDKIAEYFSEFARYLVLEFVPKSDSQVQKLLSTREDIFPNYNESDMKKAFSERFSLKKELAIPGTKRTLYLFKRK